MVLRRCYGRNDNEGPANIEEGVSVHVEEDGEDLVVGEAAQSSRVVVRKPADVTLKRLSAIDSCFIKAINKS